MDSKSKVKLGTIILSSGIVKVPFSSRTGSSSSLSSILARLFGATLLIPPCAAAM